MRYRQKNPTHKAGEISARLSNDGRYIIVNDNLMLGSISIPIELLQPIQDDLWAHDSSGHKNRKKALK